MRKPRKVSDCNLTSRGSLGVSRWTRRLLDISPLAKIRGYSFQQHSLQERDSPRQIIAKAITARVLRIGNRLKTPIKGPVVAQSYIDNIRFTSDSESELGTVDVIFRKVCADLNITLNEGPENILFWVSILIMMPIR